MKVAHMIDNVKVMHHHAMVEDDGRVVIAIIVQDMNQCVNVLERLNVKTVLHHEHVQLQVTNESVQHIAQLHQHEHVHRLHQNVIIEYGAKHHIIIQVVRHDVLQVDDARHLQMVLHVLLILLVVQMPVVVIGGPQHAMHEHGVQFLIHIHLVQNQEIPYLLYVMSHASYHEHM